MVIKGQGYSDLNFRELWQKHTLYMYVNYNIKTMLVLDKLLLIAFHENNHEHLFILIY